MNIPALASESTFIELRKYLIVCGIRADNKFRREEHEELPRRRKRTLSNSHRIRISLGLGKNTYDSKRF